MKNKHGVLYGFVIMAVMSIITMAGCRIGDPGEDPSKDPNDGGGEKPSITIKNSTGYTISGIFIKPSISTSWGSSLWEYSSLSDGSSRTFELSQSLSSQSMYDIRLTQNYSGGGFEFIKSGVTVSNGMTITFTNSDSNDGSSYPDIRILNRSGKNFDSVYIKTIGFFRLGENL